MWIVFPNGGYWDSGHPIAAFTTDRKADLFIERNGGKGKLWDKKFVPVNPTHDCT